MIAVYDSVGRIQYTVDAPYPAELVTVYDTVATSDPEFNYSEVATTDIVDKYINLDGTPTIEERPEMSLTYDGFINEGETLVIAGLPEGATVHFDGVFGGTSSEGEMETVMEDPGTYLVEVKAWPYKDAIFEVSVT